jgi:hypothetical protein
MINPWQDAVAVVDVGGAGQFALTAEIGSYKAAEYGVRHLVDQHGEKS